LGSWIGLKFQFSSNALSTLAAYGAGALLAALSIELIAPTVAKVVENSEDPESLQGFYNLLVGCLGGGLLYLGLDKVVNSKGGFLRRPSTLISHYNKLQKEEKRDMIQRMTSIPLIKDFPPEQIETLLPMIETREFKKGDVLIKAGTPAEGLLMIYEGKVEGVVKGESLGDVTQRGTPLSILPLLTGSNNMGQATALENTAALFISAENFHKLRKISPEFDKACTEAGNERLESVTALQAMQAERLEDWKHTARKALQTNDGVPDIPFMQEAREEHSGSPLAIWLGILLDGIPESLVIGAGMLGMVTKILSEGDTIAFIQVVPFTLIAGLFLSNFPEALSSSSNMLKSGMKKGTIFGLWFSLMIMTALGAGAGYLLAGQLSHTFMIGLEGLASGAMLTMIAGAMIPEAVGLGSGNRVGLSALLGFLSAIAFKLLE
jgi:zinc transporter ZupT